MANLMQSCSRGPFTTFIPSMESVGREAKSLPQGGWIIVEDFASDSAGKKILRWFRSAIRLLEATGLMIVGDEFLEEILLKTETLSAWQQDREHDLHTAAEILWAVRCTPIN